MQSSLISLVQTPTQKIYEATCLDLIRELSKDLSQDVPTGESFTSVNGIDKCVEEINFNAEIKNLYKKYHNPNIRREEEDIQKIGWQTFNNAISITKVGDHNMSIEDSILLAAEVRKDVGEDLYGILLSSAGKKKERTIFNPLHPVIVSELGREDTSIDVKEKKWSLAIYTWNDYIKPKDKFPALYNNENYINEIATIIASISTPSKYMIENKNFNVDIVDNSFIMKYDQIKRLKESGEILNEEGSGERNYIIPGQIINISGVAYPYYNVVYSRKGLAWNISPMYGANISHPFAQKTGSGMEGGSRICTHSGNANTQNGVSSLNHSNTTSPLNRSILNEGSLTYASQCVDASLEMFLGDKYKEHEAVPEKALTFQQFKEENGGNGTKAQYLSYIKNRLNNTMDKEPGEVVAEPIVQKRISPYEYHDGNKGYETGEIVIDKYMEENEFGGHRILTKNGWKDYIVPDEAYIAEAALAEADVLAEIAPKPTVVNWEAGVQYARGSLVMRRGWVFLANEHVQLYTRQEPTAMAHFWTRVRTIVEQTELELETSRTELDEVGLNQDQRELREELHREQITA